MLIPTAPARPEVDVPAMRLLAGHLSDKYRQRWLILYGVASLQFLAFPMFDHPPGWVSAPDPATLQEHMAEFERTCLPEPASGARTGQS